MNKDRIKKFFYKYFGKISKIRLNKTDFSIISNNCFGGIFYRNNSLEYLSPTCGLFFMSDEYIKFIYNMNYYLKIDDIKRITIDESKYSDYLKLIQYSGVIGKIDDLEIMFLHYKNIDEAKRKWNRRKKRINFNRIIFKFNDQNLCTYENLKKFNDFKAQNKICFTSKKYKDIDSIQIKKFKKYSYVLNDANPKDYKKNFNFYKYINQMK